MKMYLKNDVVDFFSEEKLMTLIRVDARSDNII